MEKRRKAFLRRGGQAAFKAAEPASERQKASAFKGFEVAHHAKTAPDAFAAKASSQRQAGQPAYGTSSSLSGHTRRGESILTQGRDQMLQHHINRANAKLAMMRRRSMPSKEDLHAALQQRKRSCREHHGKAHVEPGCTGHPTKANKSSKATEKDGKKASKKEGKKSAAAVAAATASPSSSGYSKSALAAANSNELQKAADPSAEDSLGLDIEANDVGYVATVEIGSKKLPFKMLIDSGSADTWVPQAPCKQCNSHQKLGTSTSSTFKPATRNSPSPTAPVMCPAHWARDDLAIAGLVLKNHTMGIVKQESDDFSDASVPFDGLMGLAKEQLSNSGTPTPIDSLYTDKLVPAPVMGYHLGRAADDDNDGEVTFGGVDATKYSGDLIEIDNVSDQGFWEIPVEGVSFDGKAISELASGKQRDGYSRHGHDADDYADARRRRSSCGHPGCQGGRPGRLHDSVHYRCWPLVQVWWQRVAHRGKGHGLLASRPEQSPGRVRLGHQRGHRRGRLQAAAWRGIFEKRLLCYKCPDEQRRPGRTGQLNCYGSQQQKSAKKASSSSH
ncbi:hypothetical protein L7F22_034849 [Adiantum nelumboides]|nr:hypothetical protein [Adiantum nelumboides]